MHLTRVFRKPFREIISLDIALSTIVKDLIKKLWHSQNWYRIRDIYRVAWNVTYGSLLVLKYGLFVNGKKTATRRCRLLNCIFSMLTKYLLEKFYCQFRTTKSCRLFVFLRDLDLCYYCVELKLFEPSFRYKKKILSYILFHSILFVD